MLAADTPLAESPRQYFRRHLQQHAASSKDLVWYLEESTPRFSGSAEVRLAVEELVDRLGQFLGFDVVRGDADEHAIWTSPPGRRLMVRVESGTRAIATMTLALQRRTQLLGLLDVVRDDDLTCLYVVAGCCDQRLLDDAAALRRASRHLRVISISALQALTRAVEDGRIAHDDAVALLRPPSALADGVIAILTAGPALP